MRSMLNNPRLAAIVSLIALPAFWSCSLRETADSQQPSTVPEPARAADASAPDGCVLIPAGIFEMGDHHGFVDPKHGGDETPVHQVRLDAFYMGIYDVTTRQYCEFLNAAVAQRTIEVRQGGVYLAGANELLCETRAMSPYSRIAWDGVHFAVLDRKEDHPIVCIRWPGAAAYCNWLSAQQDRPPCYDTATWECDFSRSGFRLPTEAEWEYAARGGLHDPYCNFPWGDDADPAKANWPESNNPFRTGPLPWTTPVGFFNGQLRARADFGWPGTEETFQTGDGANGYGLYDMAGNVWQSVNDWYARDYYGYSPADNPPGPERPSLMPDGKPYRGMRGGNWYNGEYGHSRVSNRNPSYWRGPEDPDHPYYHVGFRVVLPINAETRAVAKSTAAQAENRGKPATNGRPRQPLREQRPPRREERRGRPGGPGPRRGKDAGNPPPPREGTPKRQAALDITTLSEGKLGLVADTPKASPGYTLFAPKHRTMTYLINNEGHVVHEWTKSQFEPGQTVYLLENGHLLRCCFTHAQGFTRGGEGGRLEEYDWDDNLVWEFDYASDEHMLHHDVAVMPNGNVLALAVERKTLEDCVAAGFDPDLLRDGELFPDYVVEIEPVRPKGGRIVWEWHVWDHLIQDREPDRRNYGNVAEHPERISVNCNGRGIPAFWNHMNSIAYNAKLDQIMLSVRGCNEIWIIDHALTAEDAAGCTAGRYATGGGLLYRWGNPAAYDQDDGHGRRLFQQHDAHWIPNGYPGAGNVLIFNNGLDRGFSSVEEIVLPVDVRGSYQMATDHTYGPSEPVWCYASPDKAHFYSPEISGAHRLPNGNTLICAGVLGTFFEVTPEGETVWKYVNPVVRGGTLAQGELPGVDERGHYLNAVFKVHRYPPDYAAFAGRDLTPAGPIELPAAMKGKTGLDRVNTAPERGRRQPGKDSAPENENILRSLGYL
ncbi:MAG TPA: SUMF1/EgtB/PvdO family nonheme iron enzyme [Candidatus Hydrogenedentes bacterium]|nr:SUMF1/EgtB/PvdO family nonheme iron enzyme [Candidatus Hydrogenedentota bacterium]HQE83175.1 SUMF1/EgtB/PvdO family nonheme iron enzyme [Candidatus Hydrogenedentota bacterium]HQH54438.1 SUMF1/EgtB/PvdO family nonheme iron enzyme [Candidatus Hydrogenedentota bacterium]HQM49110.1 SUMF1/EgtB/PvdO family nonheme iron enzyme [Candidatus Hydrogenedentota bacterium]